MLADIKLLGVYCLGSLCIVIKIITSPIVMLSAWVEKKPVIPQSPAKAPEVNG